MKKRKGIEVLEDREGFGESLQKGSFYQMRIKMWLHRGEPVVWSTPYGLLDRMELSPDRTELTADYRIDREFLFAGLFYGVLDMKVGGARRLKIAPHLAYGETGVEGMIPPNALLTVEVTVLGKRY
jgi:FKBP-type peptidyl-prolyl cis-trans isomerase 2